MDCPSCGKRVAENAWICGFCDHILDASVLGDVFGEREAEPQDRGSSVREERTSIIAWKPEQEEDEGDEVPDALILGEVDASDDFQVVRGAARGNDGRTSTFLFYTSGATSRTIHPDAVPETTGNDDTLPRTPYEDFILSQIDGIRSVRDIHHASGLAPQEVVVTLLTLLDKGAVRITGVGAQTEKFEKAAADSPTDILPKSEKPPPAHPKRLETDDLEATQSSIQPSLHERPPITEESISDDLDELPVISDFEQILDEVQDELTPAFGEEAAASDPVRAESRTAPRRTSSLSDVWAPVEESDAGFQAAALVEEERFASEEVTKATVVPFEPKRVAPDRVDTKPPKNARSPAPVEELPTREDPPQDTAESPIYTNEEPPAPLPLDPAFLVEVPPSTVASAPEVTDPPEMFDEEAPFVAPVGESRPKGKKRRQRESAKAKQRAALEAAVKRGPIQERVRRAEEKARRDAEGNAEEAPQEAAAASEPESSTFDEKQSKPKMQPLDGVHMLKAQKLFEQALKDKAEGNLVSARMNMKLAMTFDPTNDLYSEAFDDLNKNPDARISGSGPTGRSRARELYDAATDAENEGDVDRAIELLEQAISHSKQPAFLNRLGVILAMKKREYDRAQQLVEQARELAPDNATYEKNLHKILSMAATADVRQQEEDQGKKSGLLGFLGRRK